MIYDGHDAANAHVDPQFNRVGWPASHESFACDCLQLHEIECAYERVSGPIGAKSYGVNSETVWPGTGC
jgi:hypothetical protein